MGHASWPQKKRPAGPFKKLSCWLHKMHLAYCGPKSATGVASWHAVAYLDDFWDSHLARHLDNFLHNLFHRVGHIPVDDLLHGNWHLDILDNLHRHWHITGGHHLMRHRHLNTLWDNHLIRHLDLSRDNLLHGSWHWALHNLLNGVWDLALHDLLDGVWNLNMLWDLVKRQMCCIECGCKILQGYCKDTRSRTVAGQRELDHILRPCPHSCVLSSSRAGPLARMAQGSWVVNAKLRSKGGSSWPGAQPRLEMNQSSSGAAHLATPDSQGK